MRCLVALHNVCSDKLFMRGGKSINIPRVKFKQYSFTTKGIDMLSKQFIKENTPALGEGLRLDCPSCGSRNTFTISNVGGKLLWNCYSASCSLSGGTSTTISIDDAKRLRSKEDVDVSEFVLPKSLVVARPVVIDWASTYSLDAIKLGILYDVIEHRAVFPIYNGTTMSDAIGRALGKRKPKWKRYGNSSVPYTCGNSKVAVLVEDAISAAVVGTHISDATGVAILGTNITTGHKQFIKNSYHKLIVALDPDARNKALVMCKDMCLYMSVIPLSLSDDLKYMNAKDMDKVRKAVS